MAQKVVTAAILAARERMNALIEDNSERRILLSDINMTDTISSRDVIQQPFYANVIAAKAVEFFGFELDRCAIVFRSAHTVDITTQNGMLLPRYVFSYFLECLNSLNTVAYKASLDFSVDTEHGLVVTDFKTIRCPKELAFMYYDGHLGMPVRLGEASLCNCMADFMYAAFNLNIIKQDAEKRAEFADSAVKSFANACTKAFGIQTTYDIDAIISELNDNLNLMQAGKYRNNGSVFAAIRNIGVLIRPDRAQGICDYYVEYNLDMLNYCLVLSKTVSNADSETKDDACAGLISQLRSSYDATVAANKPVTIANLTLALLPNETAVKTETE